MIYTSSYSYVHAYKHKLNKECVSISLTMPSEFNLASVKGLMPSWEILNAWKSSKKTAEDWEQYKRDYFNLLYKRGLNAKELAKALDGKVLLCYEGSNKRCHRSLVMQWFQSYGINCKELSYEDIAS